jgi:molecular chaperone DnaK (HSP70)
MKQSVVDAGFGTADTVFGETEPTAAIYATFTNHEAMLKEQQLVAQEIPINVMMLDMGAGTSDVTIFRFMADKQNKFHIGHDGKIISHPAVDNAYLCGGREIDRLLCDYNLNYLRQVFPGSEVHDGLKQKNESGIKEWKETHVSPRLQENLSASLPGEMMTLIKIVIQKMNYLILMKD